MNPFTSSKIQLNQEIIGEQLREKRILMKLDLGDVARKLSINVNYLQSIEEGRFDKLPVGVYGKNFLREYMYFLGIASEEALEFLGDLNKSDTASQESLFVKRVTKTHQFLLIPKIVKYTMIMLSVLVCVLYLSYYIRNIITAPVLFLDSIKTDTVISASYVDVVGRTDVQAEVSINDAPILIDTNGVFEQRINLKSGLNIITIVAQKKYSKKNIIVRKIIVKDDVSK